MTLHRTALPVIAALLGAVSLAACGDADEAPTKTAAAPAPEVQYLGPVEHLGRASMALRGMKPSVEELEAVAGDPNLLPSIVDSYVASPAFGKVVRDLHNEGLLSRVDYFYYPAGFPQLGALAGADLYHLNRSLQESSLRLIEHVVMNDRPYGEIMTADYVIANEAVATVWGSLDMVGADWQVTKWNDARPKAGILSDPWIFTRYQSTPSNKSRGRANAITKSLICYDFLSRDIEIDSSINLADPAVVDDAVVKNPACASCHQSLDPMASFFRDYFPIVVPQNFTDYPFKMNFPVEEAPGVFIDFWFEGLGEYYYTDMRPPSYFGQAAETIEDLGKLMSEDPRFSLCAVKRFYSYLNQVDLDSIEVDQIAGLQEAFLESGMNAKQLAKAIVLDDSFRVSHIDSDDETAEELVGVKKIRTDQLDSMIDDLTGFRWMLHPDIAIGQVDLLADSFVGFQVLGGGIDSAFVTRPAHTFNATSSLVLETVGAEAAAWVVVQDAAQGDPAARKLFKKADPTDATEQSVRAELAYLHARLFAELVAPDSPEVDESYALYAALLQLGGDPIRAWEGTLSAMLQDVRVATY